MERAHGVLKRFEDHGYDPQQTIQGVKSIDNISLRMKELLRIGIVSGSEFRKLSPKRNNGRGEKKFGNLMKNEVKV